MEFKLEKNGESMEYLQTERQTGREDFGCGFEITQSFRLNP